MLSIFKGRIPGPRVLLPLNNSTSHERHAQLKCKVMEEISGIGKNGKITMDRYCACRVCTIQYSTDTVQYVQKMG